MKLSRRGFLGVVIGAPLAKLLPWPAPEVLVPVVGQRPLVLRIADSPTYAFGFTGFKASEQRITGQICWEGRVYSHYATRQALFR